MTKDEALTLCRIFPEEAYTHNSNGSRQPSEYVISSLKKGYPEFNWRVILDRSGERTRWSLTVDDNDKREHYVPVGGRCIHCGETAKELGVEERNDDN
jgi:hypothetical protein